MSSSPQRLTDRKREAIVQAAVDEFRSAGYEGTSMDRIAAAAGVSKRTVYNHFPSKDALFEQIMEHLWCSSAASVNLAYRAGEPLRPQLLQLLEQKLDLLGDAGFVDLARMAMAEMIRSPARAQAMVARMEQQESAVVTWLRAAADDGQLRPLDPVFASEQLQGLVKGFAFWPQLTLGQPPLQRAQRQQVAESAVALFLGYYGTSGDA